MFNLSYYIFGLHVVSTEQYETENLIRSELFIPIQKWREKILMVGYMLNSAIKKMHLHYVQQIVTVVHTGH